MAIAGRSESRRYRGSVCLCMQPRHFRKGSLRYCPQTTYFFAAAFFFVAGFLDTFFVTFLATFFVTFFATFFATLAAGFFAAAFLVAFFFAVAILRVPLQLNGKNKKCNTTLAYIHHH